MKQKQFWLFLAVILPFSSVYSSAVIGITDMRIGNSAQNSEQMSNLLESEIIKGKSIQVRERKALGQIMDQMTLCQMGVAECAKGTGENLRGLDIITFSDMYQYNNEYILSVRAVSTDSWQVLHSVSVNGNQPEVLVKKAVAKLDNRLKTAAENPQALRKTENTGKYRMAIKQIENSNEEAQKSGLNGILENVLVSAFAYNEKFEIIESNRIKDILAEKEMAMTGLVQSDNTALNARGVTHIVTGSLQVSDEIRILTLKVTNVRTGLVVYNNFQEWTDSDDILGALAKMVNDIDKGLYETNGRLNLGPCNFDDVNISIVPKDSGRKNIGEKMQLCPRQGSREFENIPAGEYTLTFTHDDAATLVREIEIRVRETTTLGDIQLAPIDTTIFNEAQNLEYNHNFMTAIDKYQEFARKYPRHRLSATALYRVGFITQIYLQKFDEGEKILDQVLGMRPVVEIRTEALYGKAMGYYKKNEMEKGSNILNKLINDYPATTTAEAARYCLQYRECGI